MNPDKIDYKKEDGQMIEINDGFKLIIPNQPENQIDPYIMFGEEIIILIRSPSQMIEINDSSIIKIKDIISVDKILIEEYKDMNEKPNQYYAPIKFKD